MTRWLLPCLAALLLAPAAWAQENPDAERQAALAADRQSPTLDGQAGFAGSGFALTADSDASSASLAFARRWDGSQDLDFSTASIRLSAPLNKDTRVASFVTDEGFAGASSIQISYAYVGGRAYPLPLSRKERLELTERGRAACLAEAILDDETKRCREDPGPHVRTFLNEKDQARLEDAAFVDAPIWTAGFTAAVGHNTFDHRDPLNFVEDTTTRTPYSVSAYAGYSPDSRPIYWAGGLEYKVDYKAADARTLCPAVPVGTVAECFTGAFAEPAEDVNLTVFGLNRAQFPIGFGRYSIPGGLETKAAYDLEDEVFGLSAALYLAPDAAGLLRGGVKVSWSDDEDEVRIGVFVTNPFSLF